MNPASIKDIGEYQIMEHVKTTIENNLSDINTIIQKYESNNFLRKIWYGDQETIGEYPCITLEPTTTEPRWGATSYTQENTYNLDIFCYIKTIVKEVQVLYLIEFADIIRRILTHPNNLRFESEGYVIYDSGITSVAYGFKHGGALRVAQLHWFSTSWRPDVTDKT